MGGIGIIKIYLNATKVAENYVEENFMKPKPFLKLQRKKSMFGVLKAIAYCAGFPLLLLFVIAGSVQFMHEYVFEKTWYLGIGIALLPWLLTAILQIVFNRFSSSQYIKTLVVAIVAVACVLGTAGILDLHGAAVIEEVKAEYEDTAVDIPTIDYLKGHYLTTTKYFPSELDGFYDDLDEFCMIYNVGTRIDIRNGENSDGTPYVVDKKTGLPMNPNGLVSECFVYDARFAIDVILDYIESEEYLLSHKITRTEGGEDVALTSEEIYRELIALVEASDAYTTYQTSEEYLAAYSKEKDENGDYVGSAYRVMLDLADLDDMLPALLRHVGVALLNNDLIGSLSMITSMIKLDELFEQASLPDATVESLLTYIQDTFWPQVRSLVGGLLPAETLAQIEGIIAGLQVSQLEELLEELTYYYSPAVLPSFAFIEPANIATPGVDGSYELTVADTTLTFADEAEFAAFSAELKRYAYARYYAKINGAYIGSVLIPNNDAGIGTLLNSEGRIGMVTLNDNGFDNSKAWTRDELLQLKAELSYVPQLFPLLTARRFLYTFAGMVALSIILFYQFGRRQDEVIEEMCALKGGACHE